MAQDDIIFQEVDQEVEAERLRKFWMRHRGPIIGGLVLFFAGLFGFVGWQDHRVRQDQTASDLFGKARQELAGPAGGNGSASLEALLRDHPGHGYARLARLMKARVLAKGGDQAGAVGQLETLIAEAGADSPLGSLALLDAAYLTAGDPARARSYLVRIGEQSAFRAHALELEGLLARQGGDAIAALALYRKALAAVPPETLRQRLIRRVERLGGPPEVPDQAAKPAVEGAPPPPPGKIFPRTRHPPARPGSRPPTRRRGQVAHEEGPVA
ncbi:MAG: tetratricopeptide repeat protein [Magnetococcales bacterium]|nr:tetratricopeptide repeat protein [Magnetococcales bacterium]